MNPNDWTPDQLRERVTLAKDGDRRTPGDTRRIALLIDDLAISTIDGRTISLGMRVVDYNLDWCEVTGIQSVAADGTVWFETTTGMFDGGRLRARMP